MTRTVDRVSNRIETDEPQIFIKSVLQCLSISQLLFTSIEPLEKMCNRTAILSVNGCTNDESFPIFPPPKPY